MTKQTASYYVVIPHFILRDKKLTHLDKLIYGEIKALEKDGEPCYAGNQHFEELFDIGKSTVQESLANLKKNNYINIQYQNRSTKTGRIIIGLASDLSTVADTLSTVADTLSGKADTPYLEKQIEEDNHIENIYKKEKEIYKEKEQKDLSAKNALVPCSNQELFRISCLTNVWIDDVLNKHTDILLMIKSGAFQKRYPKHKTLYYTLIEWLKIDLSRGYKETMNEFQNMVIDSFDPETGAHRSLYDRYWKYCKEMEVI